jgi:glycosidase
MTFFLTLPGIPFIYYGDEIGMKFIEGMPDIEGSRNRSGSRTPMVFMRWGDGEKYIIAINPSDKKVEATISSPGTSKTVFTIGNTSKSSYRIGKKGTDTILLPPVSAAVYKLE